MSQEINKSAINYCIATTGNAYSNSIIEAYKYGAMYANNVIIEKACEWLANHHTGIRDKEFIENFKKAMENEL